MRRDFRLRIDAAFKHVLDGVDAPARTVALVSKRNVGRARRGAQTAVHAAPQYFFRVGYCRVAQLLRRKVGLHVSGLTRSGDSDMGVHSSRIKQVKRVERGFQPHA